MSILEQLIKELQAAQGGAKHDLSSVSVTNNLMHGLSGIFGQPGIERDVFATRVKPTGLLSMLPSRGSNVENPLVAYLTGFTDNASSEEKSGICDDPIAAGKIKSCLQGALFGRYERKSEQLELNAIGRQVNRGEFFDLRIVNDPLLESGFSVPGNIPQAAQDVLNREVLARWMTMGISFERLLGKQVYTANPTNNTGGGGYKEFHGLETLVGTGKIDVVTSTACPALDSKIFDWNYKRVDLNSSNLVSVLTFLWRYVNDKARRMSLDPVQWAFVMRPNLFDEIADVWPCAYSTYRCSVSNSDGERVFVDGRRELEMSIAMRNGKYLEIDGVRIPVIVDDYVPEEDDSDSSEIAAGEFASDIYLIPLTVAGGIISTFLEHIDFTQANGVMQAIMDAQMTHEYWSDGGRFLWTYHRTGWCVEWWAKLEPRMRLLTPHLAGRLQNVRYRPLEHYAEDDPDSDYFFDGGETTRTNDVYDSADFPAAL